jgi:broad specificity phosphatase PhoE
MSPREYLESSMLRHGRIEGLSELIEAGKKPPYAEFIKFMQGETDPPIDEAATGELIQEKIRQGKLNKEDFDIIICSPALRARQTSELVKQLLTTDAPVHPSEYLREARIPMGDITPEFYEQAEDISAVRKKFFESLLEGKKVDEDVVDIYRRAERFLVYLRKIREFTAKKPLFISHGIFSRFLELAVNHQGEQLDDENVRNFMSEELSETKRHGTFEGFKLASTKEKPKIIGLT